MVVNIDVNDGLVNGAIGTVRGIITTGPQVTTILVKFNTERVGATAIHKSPFKRDYPDAVPRPPSELAETRPLRHHEHSSL